MRPRWLRWPRRPTSDRWLLCELSPELLVMDKEPNFKRREWPGLQRPRCNLAMRRSCITTSSLSKVIVALCPGKRSLKLWWRIRIALRPTCGWRIPD